MHAIARRPGTWLVAVRDRLNRLLREGYIRVAVLASPRAFGHDREMETFLLSPPPQSAWPLAQAPARKLSVRRLA